jgi:hypothetical protein
MNDDETTTIIAADYMYIVFMGNNDIIKKIVNKLNQKDENNKLNIYIKYDISNPCIDILEEKHIQQILMDDAIKSIKNNCMGCVKITDSEIDLCKKYIILDEGIETAQCLIYADISSNDMLSHYKIKSASQLMMLMVLTNHESYYKLSFPILQLDEEEKPDVSISKWMKDHEIDDMVRELTIKPVNIVGNEHDILVFTAFINNN